MAAGQRPINNVVDITNYVMLLTGQPMHAFDADLVAGGTLVVRRARDGETMTTLDDVERTLDAEMVVIDDAEGPTSIAGVMGGARSEVQRRHDARADGGGDLERAEHPAHVDAARPAHRGVRALREAARSPSRALEGQAVATQLMIELCGARPVGGTIDVGGPGPAPADDPAARRAHRAAARRAGAARRRRADPRPALGFGVAEARRTGST